MTRGGPLKPSKILPRKVYPTRARQKMTPERKAAKDQPCLMWSDPKDAAMPMRRAA